jgi:hypothetical protein
LPKLGKDSKIILLYCLTFSQIWLIPRVDDYFASPHTCLTKLKRNPPLQASGLSSSCLTEIIVSFHDMGIVFWPLSSLSRAAFFFFFSLGKLVPNCTKKEEYSFLQILQNLAKFDHTLRRSFARLNQVYIIYRFFQ